ncbi:tail fiber domain-containing protein [Methylobacterium sp. J-030]|uniref:tail fiber domain-containing protein n=1 Tax=Methylobacterium sp. J-030 TaxID=2836627 RepID=UPI001FB9D252|nr:tail fiber domain-containing protein [Methylobacterium sp. J-030]MCJ2070035.1 tail fiber domain-containing protein [Methylobacterium sp. J-030]
MPGGQTSTTNSTQVADKTPWSPAIPGLTSVLGDASNLYNSGVGSQVYGGPTVAGLTPLQNQGIQSISDQFNADNSAGIGLTALQNIAMSNGGVSYNGPQLDGNGLSSGTVGALGQLQGVQGADLSGLNNFIGSTYGSQSPINQTANSFMNGSRDIQTSPIFQGLLGADMQPTSSATNLQAQANGSLLDPTKNPYLQAAVAASNQNVDNATKAAFAASGRYGSGNFAAAQAKAINDTDTQLYANQYNQAAANQLAANQQIDTANQNAISLGNTLGNSLTNVASLNNQQRLSGAGLQQAQNAQQLGALNDQLQGQEFNSGLDLSKATTALGAYQQGTANAMSNAMNSANTSLASQAQAIQAAQAIPGLDASRYAPAAQLIQGGAIQQAQNQSYLDAAQQYFNAQQQTPWQALSQYAAFPTAIAGLGGTQVTQGTQQTQTSGPSLGQTLLGGGLGLLSLGTGSNNATIGGKLLGGIGSMFGSDERMKTDIHEVGELHDGQKIYRYRYGDDPRTQIGLLAQEVQKASPDAVGPIGLGDLLGVDYGEATAAAARMAAKGSKGGGGGSSGSSAPAAPPRGLLAGLTAPDSASVDRPRVTILVSGHSGSDPRIADASGELGGLLSLMMAPGGSHIDHGAAGGLLAHAMQGLIPQEPAPIRRDKPKPPASGKRRAAA